MPKGYVIFTEQIHDQDGMGAYVGQAVGTLAPHGGRAIVVDDNSEQIEGKWFGTRTVVLEFDSVDDARKWYSSPEYQAIKGEQLAAAESNAAIVSGFEMPSS